MEEGGEEQVDHQADQGGAGRPPAPQHHHLLTARGAHLLYLSSSILAVTVSFRKFGKGAQRNPRQYSLQQFAVSFNGTLLQTHY